MKNQMERLLMLPFSIGCVTESSVAVGRNNQGKKQKVSQQNHPVTIRQEIKGKSPRGRIRRVRSFFALPKSTISQGVQRLVNRFKSSSQLFENEEEMEIGFPTDVKHVTHIGWDGSTTVNPIKGWENLKAPEIMSFPSISLKQLEIAMAAQATSNGPQTVNSSRIT